MLGSEIVGGEFTQITGLPVVVEKPSGGILEILPAGHSAKDTFLVRASQRQRKLLIEFVPGSFGAPLVEAMGEADAQGLSLWTVQVAELIGSGCTLAMQVNGMPVDTSSPAGWPQNWRFLSLSLSRNLVALDREDLDAGLLPANHWIASFAALLTALLPLAPAEEQNTEWDEEGDVQMVTHRRYERSRRNRAAAISIHGYDCRGCGLNLGRVYGPLGRDFIEIHHLEPLCELDSPRIVNPRTDLVPLCPTCHRIVHRRRPPCTIQELHASLGRTPLT